LAQITEKFCANRRFFSRLAVGNYGFGEKSTLIPKIFLVPVGLCGFLLLATRKSLPFIKNPTVPQCFG
jgi:hypothetical protein